MWKRIEIELMIGYGIVLGVCMFWKEVLSGRGIYRCFLVNSGYNEVIDIIII